MFGQSAPPWSCSNLAAKSGLIFDIALNRNPFCVGQVGIRSNLSILCTVREKEDGFVAVAGDDDDDDSSLLLLFFTLKLCFDNTF